MVTFKDGWIIVPYDGSDLVPCKIGVNNVWSPAFKDWEGKQRVLKVRPPKGTRPNSVVIVWLSVSGDIKKVGSVRVR